MSIDERGSPVRPRPDGADVRRVDEAELARFSEVLADAFYEDPLTCWVYPDDARRRERLRRGFEVWLGRLYLPVGECWTTDRFAGGAVWAPPGWSLSTFGQLRLMPATIRLAGRDTLRLLRMLAAFDRVHPKTPHWYLPFVGVVPEWQGRGFGAALLRPVLERCDADGAPAYLEATAPRNRTLYERHGFEVTEEVRIAPDAPPVWAMWREPV